MQRMSVDFILGSREWGDGWQLESSRQAYASLMSRGELESSCALQIYFVPWAPLHVKQQGFAPIGYTYASAYPEKGKLLVLLRPAYVVVRTQCLCGHPAELKRDQLDGERRTPRRDIAR